MYWNRIVRSGFTAMILAGLLFSCKEKTGYSQEEASCPMMGWSEGLVAYLDKDAKMPTDDTRGDNPPDCNFHEWSLEAFVWATALDQDGVPRFVKLHTPDELLGGDKAKGGDKTLRLSSRIINHAGGVSEGAGAIVEADGNMLVGPNGYPVYGSIHMNDSYFETAKKNMIKDGGYQKGSDSDYFEVGAAVIKATWLRLADGESPPKGAFTMSAEVPQLTVMATMKDVKVGPNGKFDTVTVALVGLHVVGYTENHPEFLWATFEHNLNAPMLPDNTFSTSGSDKNSYTFYKANTSYSQANLQNVDPPTLSFDSKTGKFSPKTNAVQMNKTGGENHSPSGPQNIANLNEQTQAFFEGLSGDQQKFASYLLIGTVWMDAGTFTADSGPTDAVGSVNLANSTAETFFQSPSNEKKSDWKNCFSCHNGSSYSFDPSLPALKKRRIAMSHVLGEGTQYAVPNVMPVK